MIALAAASVVLLCLMFGLLALPIETPPIPGMVLLAVAGVGLAWVGGALPATLAGAAAGIGTGVAVSAVVHRAFGQTPWRMYALEFLPLLALTVGLVMGAIGIGWLIGAVVRARPRRPRLAGRGLVVALLAGAAVVGGGTLLAEAIQAVVPSNAQEVHVSVVDGAIRVEPATFTASRPTFLLMEADAHLLYLPVTSDAEAARRMGGDLEDRDGLAGYIAPRELADTLRRSDFVPGRYVLVAVEPQEPIDEETVLIIDPDDPPPDTRTMRPDIAPVEFTVTD
jgi:hypothetical protein